MENSYLKLDFRVLPFLSKHWLKIAVVGFLAFVALRKDLSFQINMKAAGGTTPQQVPSAAAGSEQQANTPREALTERVNSQSLASKEQQMDSNPWKALFGGKKSYPAVEQLKAIPADEVDAFLKRFSHVAMSEQKKFGIPSSITLAEGLLLSQAGFSDASRQANNYFGIPCTKDWRGQTYEQAGKCHRHYENAWTSFRDHSFYITTGSNASLQSLKGKSPKDWAKALNKAAVFGQKDWDEQLLKTISLYDLEAYD